MQLSLNDFKACLLVATPRLMDPNFCKTVVLLMEYQSEGAVGFVINRPLNISLESVQAEEIELAEEFMNAPLWYGGPVEPNHILCIYNSTVGRLDSDTSIGTGISLAPANLLLENCSPPTKFPGTYRIIAGHAGWSAEQLDKEIQQGAWLLTELDSQFIFSTPAEQLWSESYRRLGIDLNKYHDPISKTLN